MSDPYLEELAAKLDYEGKAYTYAHFSSESLKHEKCVLDFIKNNVLTDNAFNFVTSDDIRLVIHKKGSEYYVMLYEDLVTMNSTGIYTDLISKYEEIFGEP